MKTKLSKGDLSGVIGAAVESIKAVYDAGVNRGLAMRDGEQIGDEGCGCSAAYDDGYDNGYTVGYANGYKAGRDDTKEAYTERAKGENTCETKQEEIKRGDVVVLEGGGKRYVVFAVARTGTKAEENMLLITSYDGEAMSVNERDARKIGSICEFNSWLGRATKS